MTASAARRRSALAGRAAAGPPLPSDRLERVWAWGMADSVMSHVYRPSAPEGVAEALALARSRGLRVGLRGSGRSYGDAALCAEHICLDLTRMDRILEWNPHTGVARVEPGVTIGDLWQHTLGDGWWPRVVPGTMHPTIGGCAAMNVHGKNNFRVGAIGDHILEFDLMLPSGAIRRCSRTQNADLFHAAIGGLGMLGCFTSLTLALHRVHSGLLSVEPIAVRGLGEMLDAFRERAPTADYLVGWVDCFARGAALGRGLVHEARYLPPGSDPAPAQTLRVASQELPDAFLGVLPRSLMWRFMRPLVNDRGVRLVNAARYLSGWRHHGHVHRESHAGFAFLLDYVPDWHRAYRPVGLIQYQSFIPAARAEPVFAEQIRIAQRHRLPPYLGVLKRHRPDPFLMTHSLDGYSLALDFRVTRTNRARIQALASELDRLVVEAGGRFYFAKDSTLTRESLAAFLDEERVRSFLALKRTCDPDETLQTELYRRLLRG